MSIDIKPYSTIEGYKSIFNSKYMDAVLSTYPHMERYFLC